MRTYSCVETLRLTDDWQQPWRRSDDFIDLWAEVRDWSLRPVCRLRTASEQIWRIWLKNWLANYDHGWPLRDHWHLYLSISRVSCVVWILLKQTFVFPEMTLWNICVDGRYWRVPKKSKKDTHVHRVPNDHPVPIHVDCYTIGIHSVTFCQPVTPVRACQQSQ